VAKNRRNAKSTIVTGGQKVDDGALPAVFNPVCVPQVDDLGYENQALRDFIVAIVCY
jgi:hypothetical protein